MEFLLVGDCSAPPRLVSAELKEEYLGRTRFRFRETVEYVCRPGYTKNLYVQNVLVCELHGKWHGSRDFCIREYILG